MKVTLSQQADEFLTCAPCILRNHLVEVIKAKAPKAHEQPIVIGWTCDGDYPFIERVFKDYRFRPGIRILFHVVRYGEVIHIDRIAFRDCDPYQDGR